MALPYSLFAGGRRRLFRSKNVFDRLFMFILIVVGIICGFALYHRTTNMWALKNLGDGFLSKHIGRRPIVIGAFHRQLEEQNVGGHYAVMQFVGDSRESHSLYCRSTDQHGNEVIDRAHIERIHKGKRAANDICSWAGHLAECRIAGSDLSSVQVSTDPEFTGFLDVSIEAPVSFGKRQKLVVCMAPMYIYTEWQILLTGIETWLAFGATKIIVPVQSASTNAYLILKAYEKQGIVIIRDWPKWPVLSDVNPNGLVLSRGIEESHVNCLYFVKPFADMVVFTDIDDMLLPVNPLDMAAGPMKIIADLTREHPQAGSFLFEHRDVQFVLPDEQSKPTLGKFNFNFLQKTKWKTTCKVWRMKTRVLVNASRVDSVNMHETGIHRLGYVQVRVPCRQAHFYHLRHSYRNIATNEAPIDMTVLALKLNTHSYRNIATNEAPIDMTVLALKLNTQWRERLNSTFSSIATTVLNKSSTESFDDFDRCMGSINEEHWTMSVSRDIGCVATVGDYNFARTGEDFVIALKENEHLRRFFAKSPSSFLLYRPSMSGNDSDPSSSAPFSIGRWIPGTVSETSQSVGKSMRETTSSFLGSATCLGAKIKESACSGAACFRDTTTSLAKNAIKAAGGVTECAGATVKNVAATTQECAVKAYNTTGEAASRLVTEAKAKADVAGDNAADFASEVIEDATFMGSRVCGGIAEACSNGKKGFAKLVGSERERANDFQEKDPEDPDDESPK
uniref:Glycosyltransferase family 92 protein n=1 Tax=Steinernema glaseri TaxID=37863 RepID=A0A1I8AAX0_9BILA